MTFIQAASYTPGRIKAIRLIVVHTTQGPGAPGWAVPTARGIGGYFAGAAGASSHYGVDETEVVQYVDDGDTAWCAPGANADGLHIEQCGYAEWDRSHWLTDPDAFATLRRTAALVAVKAAQYGIPLRLLTPQQVAAGVPGVCDHYAVTLSGIASGDHWDCGGGYPIDQLIALAAGGTFQPAEEEDMPLTEPEFKRIDDLISRGATRSSDAAIVGLRPEIANLARTQAETNAHLVTLIDLMRQRGGGPVDVDAGAVADALIAKLKGAL